MRRILKGEFMIKINTETINTLIGAYDGNFSLLYPAIKKQLSKYTCYELQFPEEFLFFELRYLKTIRHMIENNINLPVVDVGCQLGIQSVLFEDYGYTGIDIRNNNFLNSDKFEYIVSDFADVDIDLSNKTVISSMSLGYFGGDEDAYIKKLSTAKHLYIASTSEFISKISKEFMLKYRIDKQRINKSIFDMYYFTNINE